jgi:hypothetical protein
MSTQPVVSVNVIPDKYARLSVGVIGRPTAEPFIPVTPNVILTSVYVPSVCTAPQAEVVVQFWGREVT